MFLDRHALGIGIGGIATRQRRCGMRVGNKVREWRGGKIDWGTWKGVQEIHEEVFVRIECTRGAVWEGGTFCGLDRWWSGLSSQVPVQWFVME